MVLHGLRIAAPRVQPAPRCCLLRWRAKRPPDEPESASGLQRLPWQPRADVNAVTGCAVQRRQQFEYVALEGEITHDEAARQAELAGRPEQPPHRVGRAHLQRGSARRPQGGAVPELETDRRLTTEEVGQEGGQRQRRPASRNGLVVSGLLPGPQWARPGK